MPDTAASPPAAFSHREILSMLSGTMLGMFLGALDQTIVATALPAMASELHGMEHMSWVVSAYLLTATASTPVYGKLSDLYGRRLLFRTALFIFVLGSVACALAQDMGQLILSRAVQGLGGGGLVSLALTIVADIVPPRERGRYQGYFAAVFGTATVGGPILGGFIADALSWRWVFWLNVPIGLAALVICNAALRRLPVHGGRRHIDWLGGALLLPAIVVLLLVTTWGGTALAWTSPLLLGLVALAAALIALLGAQEMRAEDPLLPPRLFRENVFLIGNAMGFVGGAASVGAVIFLPLFLQIVIGTSAGNSGLLIAPMMLGMTVSASLTGRLMRRTGRYRMFPLIGLALTTTAFLLFIGVTASTPALRYGLYMAALGFGLGPINPTVTIAVQNAVHPRDLGAATASTSFFRTMGGSFGVALLGAILFAG